MNRLVPGRPPAAPVLPRLITAAGDRAGIRFLEFFVAPVSLDPRRARP